MSSSVVHIVLCRQSGALLIGQSRAAARRTGQPLRSPTDVISKLAFARPPRPAKNAKARQSIVSANILLDTVMFLWREFSQFPALFCSQIRFVLESTALASAHRKSSSKASFCKLVDTSTAAWGNSRAVEFFVAFSSTARRATSRLAELKTPQKRPIARRGTSGEIPNTCLSHPVHPTTSVAAPSHDESPKHWWLASPAWLGPPSVPGEPRSVVGRDATTMFVFTMTCVPRLQSRRAANHPFLLQCYRPTWKTQSSLQFLPMK